jgi:hypothetical protein
MELVVKGASREQLEAGLAAAHKVLASTGFTPAEAAAGAFAVEGWDVAYDCDAKHRPTQKAFAAASAWRMAMGAAIAACCAGWSSVPDDCDLELGTADTSEAAERLAAMV